MQNTLTIDDINNIIAALKQWEAAPMRDAVQNGMFSSLLCGLIPKNEREGELAKIRNEREAEMRKAEQEQHRRQDESVLLQAKLLQLRNELIKAIAVAS